MQVSITYETAKHGHPDEFRQILEQLAKSKSREKGSLPEDLNWFYNWTVEFRSTTLNGLLTGSATADTRFLEERTYCTLVASKGRWFGCSSRIAAPAEVLASMDQTKTEVTAAVKAAMAKLMPPATGLKLLASRMDDDLLVFPLYPATGNRAVDRTLDQTVDVITQACKAHGATIKNVNYRNGSVRVRLTEKMDPDIIFQIGEDLRKGLYAPRVPR